MPRSCSQQIPSFDAKALLNITRNQNHGGRFTCMGETLQGRRCRNPRKETVADYTLNQLPRVSPSREMLQHKLVNLEKDVYCHLHRQQAPRTVWFQIIREEARKCGATQPSTRSRCITGSTAPNEASTTIDAILRPSTDAADSVQSASLQPEQTPESTERTVAATSEQVEEESCPICFMSFGESCQPAETPCGHKFCFECINLWLDDHETCPTDRRPLRKSEIKAIPFDSLCPCPVADAEEDPCAICLLSFSDSSQLGETPCGHKFCLGCIDTWLDQNETCPMDRQPLLKSSIKAISSTQA